MNVELSQRKDLFKARIYLMVGAHNQERGQPNLKAPVFEASFIASYSLMSFTLFVHEMLA